MHKIKNLKRIGEAVAFQARIRSKLTSNSGTT